MSGLSKRAALLLVLLAGCWEAQAKEPCLTPTPRDPKAISAFRRANPCPATGLTTGPCKDWRVDHKYPLCACGTNDQSNLQWEPLAHSKTKDRLEIEVCALQKKCAVRP